jgi:hypothetical protein
MALTTQGSRTSQKFLKSDLRYDFRSATQKVKIPKSKTGPEEDMKIMEELGPPSTAAKTFVFFFSCPSPHVYPFLESSLP